MPIAHGRAWFLILPDPLSILCSLVGGALHYKLYHGLSPMSTDQDYVGCFGSHLAMLTNSELAVKTQSVFTTCARIQLHSFQCRTGTVGDLRSQSVELSAWFSLAHYYTYLIRWSAVSPDTPCILVMCLSFPLRLV